MISPTWGPSTVVELVVSAALVEVFSEVFDGSVILLTYRIVGPLSMNHEVGGGNSDTLHIVDTLPGFTDHIDVPHFAAWAPVFVVEVDFRGGESRPHFCHSLCHGHVGVAFGTEDIGHDGDVGQRSGVP